jgi:uncharacterized membrane protein YjgN (DUF898 family)
MESIETTLTTERAAAPATLAEVSAGQEILEFRGSAAEYFRIWIVNLALTVLTLGIYSAWAKVRKLKYLHGQTYLAGSAFGYHGEPLKILKGRAIAVVFFAAYALAGELHPVAAVAAALVLALVMPWLVVKALKFRMRMTSWRGLRFDFTQDFRGGYRVYLGWGALMGLTLGLLFPQFVRQQQLFAVRNSSYGATPFACDAPTKPYYVAALKALGITMAVGFVLGLALAGLFGSTGEGEPSLVAAFAPLAVVFAIYLAAYPVFQAGVLNAMFQHTSIGPHRFQSRLGGARLAWLYLSNTLAIVASFGLLIPWATVRVLRYRLDSLTLETGGSLDAFVAGQAQAAPGAAGEELSDFFDVDFGF